MEFFARHPQQKTGPLAATLAILLFFAQGAQPAAERAAPAQFNIAAQSLPDALDRFGEQSGLQIVYDHTAVVGKNGPEVAGKLFPEEVLDALLKGTGLTWTFVDAMTVALSDKREEPVARSPRARAPASTSGDITSLSVIKVTEDPRRVLPNESSTSAFGFDKPLLETPRSVSFISQETIDLLGLSAVEDLVRVVPGTFTTTRFGIQGSIDIRNVPADTYFRGMKRVNLQGHGRSVLAAMDTIEIVRGPPSPLYGMGKIGGYTSVVPKSGRAAMGGYLEQSQGFAQAILGSYGRSEIASGFGGPLRIDNRVGGFYVYGLLESSDSYASHVPISQKVGQGALNIDEFAGPFRLEAGFNYQLSGTAGALTNRLTQDVVDNGRYVRGSPLAMLDLNGNGKIGYLEMERGSPVLGSISASNQPLVQRFDWPTDAGGNPLPLDQFPVTPGIPQSMYDYLVAHPEADPTGLLRAQGAGGPVPVSGYVPIGMVLDPRTVGYGTLDLRRAGSLEKELEAEFMVGYFDLVYDTDPDFTIKNQLFFDSMDQFKLSEQPGGGKQDVYVWEDKFTVTKRLTKLPAWLRVNTLGSLNFRYTRATGERYGGDFANHRTDALDGDGMMSPNSTFVHPLENDDLASDGAAWTSHYETGYSESGLGLLADIDVYDRTNLLLGGRIDYSTARNTDFAAFNALTGTAGNPGSFAGTDQYRKAADHGASWSLSVSHELPYNLHPYATLASSSISLESNNNKMDNAVIANGHIGNARLLEAGIKAGMLDERLFISTAVYEQTRTDVDDSDALALLNAEVTSTRTTGWESELKWVPSRELMISLYALKQKTVFSPNKGANIMVDARTLGFQDIVDAQGNVIYPAEAFLYGGRAFISLPANLAQYEEKQGNPSTQLGLNLNYQFANGLGLATGANHFSKTYSGRLKLIELPAADVFNASLFWDAASWQFKVDVLNVTDERYFRARTGDTLGETLVQAMPGRRWQLTIRRSF